MRDPVFSFANAVKTLKEDQPLMIGEIQKWALPGFMDLMANEGIGDVPEGLNTPRKIHSFFSQFEYVPDTDLQTFRSVRHTLRHRAGNCVNLSIAAAAALKKQGIPFCYELIAYEPNSEGDHVYISVFEKKNSQNKTILDPTLKKFGKEVDFYRRTSYCPENLAHGSGPNK
jgi:hypothetical protein